MTEPLEQFVERLVRDKVELEARIDTLTREANQERSEAYEERRLADRLADALAGQDVTITEGLDLWNARRHPPQHWSVMVPPGHHAVVVPDDPDPI